MPRGGGHHFPADGRAAGEEDRVKALAAGYQMHVAKPVEPSELIATVLDLARMAAAIGRK